MAAADSIEFPGLLRSVENSAASGLPVLLSFQNGAVNLRSNEFDLGTWPTSTVEGRHRRGRTFTLVIEDEPWIFEAAEAAYFMDVGLSLLAGDPDVGWMRGLVERQVRLGSVVLVVAAGFLAGAVTFAFVESRRVELGVSFLGGLAGGVLVSWLLILVALWLRRVATYVGNADDGAPGGQDEELEQHMLKRLAGRFRRAFRAAMGRVATTLRTGLVSTPSREDMGASRTPSSQSVGRGVSDGLSYSWKSYGDDADILSRFLPAEQIRRDGGEREEAADVPTGAEAGVAGQEEADREGGGTSQPKAKREPGEEADDLTLIKGIGPSSQDALYEMGYRTFVDLALLDEGDFESVTEALGPMAGRMKRDDWIGQAARLFFEKQKETLEAGAE